MMIAGGVRQLNAVPRRKHAHVRRAIALASTLLLAGFLEPPAVVLAASANGPCQGDPLPSPVYHGGADVLWTGAAGAEGRFDSIAPALCTTASDQRNGSLSWVSISTFEPNSIVQIGTAKCDVANSTVCNGVFRLFYAWGRDQNSPGCGAFQNVPPAIRSLGAAPSGTNTYTVRRTTTEIQFLLNGATKTTIGVGNICWTGDGAEWKGETWDKGDQMGGTVGDKQNFTNALYQRSVNGSWLSPSFSTCSVISVPPGVVNSYDCTRVNGQAVNVWTDRS